MKWLSKITDPDRWAVLQPLDIGGQEDPYVDRLVLVKTPLGGIYLPQAAPALAAIGQGSRARAS